MNRIKIAFDLDNTLINFSAVFEEMLYLYHGIKIKIDDTSQYELHKTVPLPQEDIDELIRVSSLAISCFEPLPGVVDFLTGLYERTLEPVCIITARPHDLSEKTYDTVESFCPVPYNLIFQGAYHKSVYLTNYKFFVEDRRRTALQLVRQGINVFLINKGYNQCLGAHGLIRLENGIEDLLPNIDSFVDTGETGHKLQLAA